MEVKNYITNHGTALSGQLAADASKADKAIKIGIVMSIVYCLGFIYLMSMIVETVIKVTIFIVQVFFISLIWYPIKSIGEYEE